MFSILFCECRVKKVFSVFKSRHKCRKFNISISKVIETTLKNSIK
ncbi:unnamed protein product [Chironomus riparius]|uniref:Uncharacterized protein n=1 Tax=Chironomus riparius TaxID=315576 RepID=A0A9N9RWX2_9DIPT|nr:unnamed protein product [Chironomus riparius]